MDAAEIVRLLAVLLRGATFPPCNNQSASNKPVLAFLQVDSRQEIEGGSPEEVEVRAATIVAVERIRSALVRRLEPGGMGAATNVTSVKVDWWLWDVGEREKEQHRPHHRTLTIYY